jgi:hypothetical protein
MSELAHHCIHRLFATNQFIKSDYNGCGNAVKSKALGTMNLRNRFMLTNVFKKLRNKIKKKFLKIVPREHVKIASFDF